MNYIILYYIVLYYIILYAIISYHIILCHTILYFSVVLYYIISYYILLYWLYYIKFKYIYIYNIYIYIHTDRGFAPLLIWVSPSTPVSQLQQAIMSLVKASNGIMGMYIVGLRQLGFGMMTFPIWCFFFKKKTYSKPPTSHKIIKSTLW